MSATNYVASALMQAWFPRIHSDQSWLNSDDGRNWTEIALLDAQVSIDAYNEWLNKEAGGE